MWLTNQGRPNCYRNTHWKKSLPVCVCSSTHRILLVHRLNLDQVFMTWGFWRAILTFLKEGSITVHLNSQYTQRYRAWAQTVYDSQGGLSPSWRLKPSPVSLNSEYRQRGVAKVESVTEAGSLCCDLVPLKHSRLYLCTISSCSIIKNSSYK